MTKLEFLKNIAASQRGNRKAFQALYEEYFGRLSKTAFMMVRNADAAHDIATDVIIKLLDLKSDVFRIENHITYMVTMVKNRAKDYLVKRSYEVGVAEICNSDDTKFPNMLWLEDVFRTLTEEEREIFLWHYIWFGKSKKIKGPAKIKEYIEEVDQSRICGNYNSIIVVYS